MRAPTVVGASRLRFKVRMVENLSGAFLVNNNLKHGDDLSSLLFKVALESASDRSKKCRRE